MRRTLIATALSLLAIPLTAVAAMAGGSGGVTGPSFYVDGTLYRTVGTPTDLSGTGAPSSSFETIYAIGNDQPNVATAAPGDPGFRGGRWQVHGLSFDDYDAAVATYDANGSGDFDSAAEVAAALTDGAAVDTGIVKSFECPVIPVPHGG
jgi:hypothetical protein